MFQAQKSTIAWSFRSYLDNQSVLVFIHKGFYLVQQQISTNLLTSVLSTSVKMEESTLILAKKIAEQGLTDDADAAEAFDGSPKPLRKMQGKLQGFR